MSAPLNIWTVYDHPTDFPDYYVARMHTVTDEGSTPTQNVVMSTNLETVRHILCVDMKLVCIPRYPEDDPKIVELWL